MNPEKYEIKFEKSCLGKDWENPDRFIRESIEFPPEVNSTDYAKRFLEKNLISKQKYNEFLDERKRFLLQKEYKDSCNSLEEKIKLAKSIKISDPKFKW